MAQQKKNRKVGRPKLPKGEAKGRTVQVRLASDDLRSVVTAARTKKQILSDWIRDTLRRQVVDTWTVVLKDGKKATFTYREVGRDRAIMTAQIEGNNLNRLEKAGLPLPLSHQQVQAEFHSLVENR